MIEQQDSRHDRVQHLETALSDLRAKVAALEERDACREEELANVSRRGGGGGGGRSCLERAVRGATNDCVRKPERKCHVDNYIDAGRTW